MSSRSIGYVFPGQGSQSKGMLQDFALNYPEFLDSFHLASEIIHYDLWDLIQNDPHERLNHTEYTQVAMLVSDVALALLMKKNRDLAAKVFAGHSLGEYAALVIAEALTLQDAVLLVQDRSRLMQSSVPIGKGAMAAIVGLSDEAVFSVCERASTEDMQVMPANFNALGQVVIAGDTKAVNDAISFAELDGARLAKIIPVSVPCHCSLLKQAAALFSESLNKTTIHMPKYPVLSNVDAAFYTSPSNIQARLAEQLYQPVQWVKTIQHMKAMGVDTIIEVGPGKVLTGLIKRIDREIKTFNVTDIPSFNEWLSWT